MLIGRSASPQRDGLYMRFLTLTSALKSMGVFRVRGCRGPGRKLQRVATPVQTSCTASLFGSSPECSQVRRKKCLENPVAFCQVSTREVLGCNMADTLPGANDA
ncbi:hypothetical protein BaRGS_00009057, partial [Batillaria attramentaria]